MEIKYDKEARAAYIKIKKGKIDKTIKLKDSLIIDLDKNGEVLGIELLDFSFPITAGKQNFPIKIPIYVK